MSGIPADVRREKFGVYKVTTGVMAEVMGINPKKLAQYEALYTPLEILPNGHRVYDLVGIVQHYISTIKADEHDENTIASRRLKVMKQQERKLRMENDERAGDTMRVATTIGLLQDILNCVRAGTEALPARVAQQFSGLTNPREIRRQLERELDEIFEMAGEFITDYQETAAQRAETGVAKAVAGSVADIKSAPAKVSRRVGGRKPSAAKRKRRTRKVAK